MNSEYARTTNNALLGRLYARTPEEKDISITSWIDLITEITSIAYNANALITIQANPGSGTTTFLKTLRSAPAQNTDVIVLAPSCEISHSGWLLNSLISWISGANINHKSLQKSFTDLAETARSITICIDTSDLIEPNILLSDICAMLNLADTCDLKLSIIVCGSDQTILPILGDQRAASRLIFSKKLPEFNEVQSREFLKMKLSTIEDLTPQSIKPSQTELDQIIRKSQKYPIDLIRQLSTQIGLETPSRNKHVSQDMKKPKSTLREKPPSEASVAKLEDLLAPRKSQG